MSSGATSSQPNSEAPRFVPRVLLSKSFIDSHDRAIGTIAKTLRDAGMEVILVEYQVPQEIAMAAVQEDVDVIGVSFMSGGQVDVTQQLQSTLRAEGHDDLPVVIGGTIRPFDIPDLEQAGVRAIFRGGETMASVASTFAELARESRARH
jgi:methylmalonyl-CoA mutase C-terminal domain/subunit